MRLALIVSALLVASCGLRTVGAVRMPLAENQYLGAIGEAEIRNLFPAVPADWILIRDCYESEVVPSVHEFAFVPEFEGVSNVPVLAVACREECSETAGCFRSCERGESRKTLLRTGDRFVELRSEAQSLELDFLLIALADYRGGTFGWGTDELYAIEATGDSVELSFGGCGCYASLRGTRARDGLVDLEDSFADAICF